MESVKWLFELVDKVSGPSSGMLGALERVDKRFNELEKKRPSEGFERRLRVFRLFAAEAEGPLKSLTSSVASWGLALGAAAAGVLIAGTTFAVQAASFKRDTVRAFGFIDGIGNQAERVFDSVAKMSRRTIFEDKDFFAMFRSLVAAGLSENRADDVLAAISDISALQGEEGAAKGKALTEAIVKIKSNNKFDQGALEQISQASGGAVTVTDLLKTIGKARGLATGSDAAVDSIKKLVESGVIKQTEGINAILETVNTKLNKGKGLGGVSKDFLDNSLPGQITRIKKEFESLFRDVNVSPFINVLQSIGEALDGESEVGQRLRAKFNEVFGDIGSTLEKVFTTENIGEFLIVAADIVGIIWDISKAFGEGFLDTLKDMFEPLMTVIRLTRDGGTGAGSMADAFAALGQVLGVVVAIVGYAAVGVAGLAYGVTWLGGGITRVVKAIGTGLKDAWNWVVGFAEKTLNWGKDLVADFLKIGENIISGFVEGLEKKWNEAKETVSDIAKGITDTVKGVLGIQSPSKVFMAIGRYTVEGFAKGVNDNAELPTRAIESAIDVAYTPTVQATASATTSAPNGKTIVINQTVNITVQGGGGQDFSELREQIRAELRAALQEALQEAA